MIEIVPCERQHLESMKGRTIDEIPANPPDLSASVSIVKNGIVIGSGGLIHVEEDNYYVWSVLTPECVEKHKVTLHKIGKKFMEEVAPELGIKRITAFVRIGFTTGVEWAEVFGFEREEHVHVVASTFGALQGHMKMRRIWAG